MILFLLTRICVSLSIRKKKCYPWSRPLPEQSISFIFLYVWPWQSSCKKNGKNTFLYSLMTALPCMMKTVWLQHFLLLIRHILLKFFSSPVIKGRPKFYNSSISLFICVPYKKVPGNPGTFSLNSIFLFFIFIFVFILIFRLICPLQGDRLSKFTGGHPLEFVEIQIEGLNITIAHRNRNIQDGII